MDRIVQLTIVVTVGIIGCGALFTQNISIVYVGLGGLLGFLAGHR